MTRDNLGTVMLTIGLMLVAIAGVITWLITLYSSFRIVGPLYRFTQNLKLAGTSDSSPLIELRKGDALSEQSAGIKMAVAALRDHYTVVQQVSEEALSAFEKGDSAGYQDAVERLRALDAQVRV